MSKYLSGYITLSVITLAIITSGLWYILPISPLKTKATTETNVIGNIQPIHMGHHIVVNLDQMTLNLMDGTTTIKKVSIVSRGKPGSYYETIGGAYVIDYKEPIHFSTIGHVYMPYSVHIFGNFFIHGIPYYPDGTKVSSTYSGGCVRLNDVDAKLVYEFVSLGTPIIITRSGEYDFEPTSTTTPTIESMDMTRLMVATISLEFLTQDNEILNTDNTSNTTRRTLISRLLKGDDDVALLYAKSYEKNTFLNYMNAKAKALGLTNTTFTDIQKPAETTEEDLARFMNHIDIYKSYLNTVNIP